MLLSPQATAVGGAATSLHAVHTRAIAACNIPLPCSSLQVRTLLNGTLAVSRLASSYLETAEEGVCGMARKCASPALFQDQSSGRWLLLGQAASLWCVHGGVGCVSVRGWGGRAGRAPGKGEPPGEQPPRHCRGWCVCGPHLFLAQMHKRFAPTLACRTAGGPRPPYCWHPWALPCAPLTGSGCQRQRMAMMRAPHLTRSRRWSTHTITQITR